MDFGDGYPLGNGTVGIWCIGGAAKPNFVINHAGFWYCPPGKSAPRPGYWEEVQKAAMEKKWGDLQGMLVKAFAPWGNPRDASYQPAVTVEFALELPDGTHAFERSLDLASRTAEMRYKNSGHDYRITAAVHLSEPEGSIHLETADPAGIRAVMRIYREEDERFPPLKIDTTEDGLLVAFSLDEQTSIRGRFIAQALSEPLREGTPLERHRAPHEGYYRLPIARAVQVRFVLELQSRLWLEDAVKDPEESRYYQRAKIRLPEGGANDPEAPHHYECLHTQGRYVFSASTQTRGLPPNLQGIWNARTRPPCNSDWHFDLNVQMAYWHVPTGNLLELHEPYFRLVERMLEGGRANARDLFGMRGIAFPMGCSGHGYGKTHFDAWAGTSGWIMQHFDRHWRYTRDREFLKERYFPIIHDVCQFYLDYLMEEGERMLIAPSQSPENRLPEFEETQCHRNTTYDLAIFKEVFSHFLEYCGILEISPAIKEGVKKALSRLPGYSLSQDGRLMEFEGVETKRGHRHLVHLYPLFPGSEITLEDKTMSDAAALALARFRSFPSSGMLDWMYTIGSGAWAGWTYPLLANCYARLGKGEEALEMLRRYARTYHCAGGMGLCFEAEDSGFGLPTTPEVPPEKWILVDAPLGAVSAIQEMLLQSHRGIIRVLPALPLSWTEGAFHNLLAEGGFEISTEWSGNRWKMEVRSKLGGPCTFKLECGRSAIEETGLPSSASRRESGMMTFETVAGESYFLEGSLTGNHA